MLKKNCWCFITLLALISFTKSMDHRVVYPSPAEHAPHESSEESEENMITRRDPHRSDTSAKYNVKLFTYDANNPSPSEDRNWKDTNRDNLHSETKVFNQRQKSSNFRENELTDGESRSNNRWRENSEDYKVTQNLRVKGSNFDDSGYTGDKGRSSDRWQGNSREESKDDTDRRRDDTSWRENTRNNEMTPNSRVKGSSFRDVGHTVEKGRVSDMWRGNSRAKSSSFHNEGNMNKDSRRDDTSSRENTSEIEASENSRSGKKSGQRLCERKYMEYMTRIFHDEDTVADGSDSDFNGRVLVEPGQYPHMTAIGFTSPNQRIDYKCGGSLVSENFVITAAHCTNFTGQQPTKIRIGDLNLMVEERYLEPQTRNVKRIINHPDYLWNFYYNDIALVELDVAVELTEFVRPIRLWTDTHLPPNTVAHAMGYGATAFGKAPTKRLTDLNMTIVSNEECKSAMPQMPEAPLGVITSLICAKDYLMNRDTCQGDSGGPLQLNLRGRRRRDRQHYHLIGITSYGLFCRSGYPSMYTRITSFLDWIEDVVWNS